MNYYSEQIEMLKRQLANSNVGFRLRINELAEKIIRGKEEEQDDIIKELFKEVKAMKELKDSLTRDLEFYEKKEMESFEKGDSEVKE